MEARTHLPFKKRRAGVRCGEVKVSARYLSVLLAGAKFMIVLVLSAAEDNLNNILLNRNHCKNSVRIDVCRFGISPHTSLLTVHSLKGDWICLKG